MKRLLIVVMIIGLVVGSVATAEAKKAERNRIERTVEGDYQAPFVAQVTGCDLSDAAQFGCLMVESRPGEEFLTATVTDALGQPVYFEVSWDFDGESGVGPFCGETPRPIRFRRGAEVWVRVGVSWPLPPLVDCPLNRLSTTGTISMTLSNLP